MNSRDEPISQGDLDQLCGIYAAINALSAVEPRMTNDDQHVLFRRMISKISEGDRSARAILTSGLDNDAVARCLRNGARYISNEHGRQIELSEMQPRLKLNDLLYVLRYRLGRRCVAVANVRGTWSHWTVIARATKSRLYLIDSAGRPNISMSTLSSEERGPRLRAGNIILVTRGRRMSGN